MDFLAALAARAAAVSPAELAVTRVAFRGILAGRPARTADVPDAAVLPTTIAHAALDALLARGSVAVDGEGAIVVARGLSLRPTPHRLSLAGRHEPLFAGCAVDAVGIPAALTADGAVASRCHHCATPMALTARAGGISAPAGLVIWAADDDGHGSVRALT